MTRAQGGGNLPAMSRTDAVAHGLLQHLREALGEPGLELAEPPAPLGGGFDTEIYTFRLRAAPSAWLGPLVLRLLRSHHDPQRARREETTQNALADLGYPVPRVLLTTIDPTALGTAFLVMERLPGAPLATRPVGMAGVLCDVQLRLHGLDATPLARALGDTATLDGYLAALDDRITAASLAGLAGAMTWLRQHRPRPAGPPVICHGDLHPQNILVNDGRPSGVLDWPNALVADPAFDVASTRLILRFVPPGLTALPPALRWLAHVGQPILARRYLAGYRRRRPIARGHLAYYEVAAAMRALVRAGERRTAGGPPSNLLDRSSYAIRLLAHVRDLSGVDANLPPAPP